MIVHRYDVKYESNSIFLFITIYAFYFSCLSCWEFISSIIDKKASNVGGFFIGKNENSS